MFQHLNDYDFLLSLDKNKIKVQYAKIVLLDFNEKPIKEIEGRVSSGSISVNGSAAIRRTINLTMLADINAEDDFSLNKKVKIYIGYLNPFKKYANILWFPCGMYVIANANVSRGVNGWNISLTGKDKMVMLDGSVGGMLPASVTFHESYVYNEDGSVTIVYPTVYQIVQEAVHHWGEEDINNIFINNLSETAKLLVKYMGDDPIYMNDKYSAFSYAETEDYKHRFVYNQDIGYRQTSLTYPRELILDAGETVVSLLNKIVDFLGNFEYFYDIEGRFIFQEKQNYLNTSSDLLNLDVDNYMRSYSNARYKYVLTDLDSVSSIAKNPRYDNIKNDFIVWGKKTLSNGAEIDIRYHLAVDAKPLPDMITQYMWAIYEGDILIRYEFTNGEQPTNGVLIGEPCEEWREELYRQALSANLNGTSYSYYDMELLAEWRSLYDSLKTEWKEYGGWNPDVFYSPGNLRYWLDFIDTGSEVGKYSINMIGRRTKVHKSDDIKSVFNTTVPDVIFLTEEEWQDEDRREYYESIGQPYSRLNADFNNLFVPSATGVSAYEKVRELLYQHLSLNTQITIQCFPKYYIEPNNIIYIEDAKTGVVGNYVIEQFNLPLTYNGTMSITASEVLTRV